MSLVRFDGFGICREFDGILNLMVKCKHVFDAEKVQRLCKMVTQVEERRRIINKKGLLNALFG